MKNVNCTLDNQNITLNKYTEKLCIECLKFIIYIFNQLKTFNCCMYI